MIKQVLVASRRICHTWREFKVHSSADVVVKRLPWDWSMLRSMSAGVNLLDQVHVS